MNEREIDLGSVHWVKGMLLTPEHFLRQEQYMDSLLLWVMRYAASNYGLVGAGARSSTAERGAARYDPLVNVDDTGEEVRVSVSQCRGITPAGDLVEIDPGQTIHCVVPKEQLDGTPEPGVFVICWPHDKIITEEAEDAANPQSLSTRRQRYRVQLDVTAAQAPHSLLLCRLQRVPGSMRYEKMPGFIPLCTTMIGHSELKRAWERLREQLTSLAEHYTHLHEAMVDYVAMAGQRGLQTREDDETLMFVGRMVMALENGAYDALDPLQSPQQFFQKLYRVVRSAAVYLNLSPPTRQYFRQLAEVGVNEYGALPEQERQLLLASRDWTMHENLSLDVQQIEQSLARLRHLEEALEGKYVDYRLSRALEALTFFFDRRTDPPALYQSLHKPSRPQIYDNELTFVLAPLRLEGRQSYRVVLICENEQRLERGQEIETEILLNAGAGQDNKKIYQKARCELINQRNLAIDFDAPADVHTITDVRINLNARWPIRSCILYGRKRAIQHQAQRQAVPPPDPLPPAPLRREAATEPGRRPIAPQTSRLSPAETDGWDVPPESPPYPAEKPAPPRWRPNPPDEAADEPPPDSRERRPRLFKN